MTNQEWESKMDELCDAQLVTQRLMELNERRWNERIERHDVEISELRTAMLTLVSHVKDHETQIAELRAGMLELRAAMTSLIAHIDRFIQGRQPDGH